MDLNILATIKRITWINMLGSIPHQKFCFYHLPTRGRAGIKLGDAWYVSNVSIIFDCSMLYYLLFWTLLGFIIHFYIIFGTNLLTGGPAQNCCFLPISEFRRKGISNGVQTEWNLRESYFWNKHNPGDLEWTSRKKRGGHEAGGRAPHPRGPLVAPLTDFFHLYMSIYPKNIEEQNRLGVSPPEASVATGSQSIPVPAPCRRGNPSPMAIFIILVLSMTMRE